MLLSHPSRVRGLKLKDKAYIQIRILVAPFTGAWIEMYRLDSLSIT